MKRNGILAIFIVLVVATASLAYLLSPQSPSAALASALAKTRDATHVSGVVTVTTLLPGRAVPGSGGVDVPISLHGAMQFDLPTEAKAPVGEAALTVFGSAQGGTGDVLVEMKSLSQGAFLRISNLPKAPGAALPAEMDGKWYSTDIATVGSLLAGGGTAPVGKADASAAMAAYERLRAAVGSGSMFATDGGAVTEIVDGAPAYKFVFDVSPDARSSFAQDLRVMLLGKTLGKDEADKVDAEVRAEDLLVTLWVDRRSGEPRKAEVAVFGHGTQGGVTQDFRIDSIDLATPAQVDAPPSSTPFADVIAKIGAQQAAPPAAPAPKPAPATGKKK